MNVEPYEVDRENYNTTAENAAITFATFLAFLGLIRVKAMSPIIDVMSGILRD